MKPAYAEPFQRFRSGLKVAQAGRAFRADHRNAEKVFRQGPLSIAVDDAFLLERLADEFQLLGHDADGIGGINGLNDQAQPEPVLHVDAGLGFREQWNVKPG